MTANQPTRPAFWWWVLKKDWLVEARKKELLFSLGFFSFVTIVIYSLTFLEARALQAKAISGVLWTTTLFVSTLGINRVFGREKEEETLHVLLLTVRSRRSVFIGKAFSIALFVVFVQLALLPLCALFFDVNVFAHAGWLLLVVLLGALGIGTVASVFATMLLGSSAKDVLFPIALFPMLVPLVVAGHKLTAPLVTGEPGLALGTWLPMMLIYDLAFWILGLVLFGRLAEE